jgi:hypothetical protein
VQFAQLEAAASVSSPIFTQGVSVTRGGERVAVTASPGVTYPLTMFIEYERAEDIGVTQQLLQIDDGSTTDRTFLNINASDARSLQVIAGNVAQTGITVGTNTVGVSEKAAARIGTNDAMMAVGGVLSAADTSITLPPTPIGIRFAGSAAGSGGFMYIKRVALFNSLLNNAQLQTITT